MTPAEEARYLGGSRAEVQQTFRWAVVVYLDGVVVGNPLPRLEKGRKHEP